MKYLNIILIFLLVILSTNNGVFAQADTLDLIVYSAPRDSAGKVWKKEVAKDKIGYTMTNKKNNSWCQIFILKSTTSKGSIEQDLESEWKDLIVKNYKPSEAPQLDSVHELEGWKIQAASAGFTFNKANAVAILTTASGYDRCVSIIAITNSQEYTKNIETLLSSVDLIKPQTVAKTTVQPTTAVTNSGFKFTTSNFDDGWTSTVQEDWVEVKKGSNRVLLHYPKEGTIFPADPDVLTNAAWNILVAPRYSNLKNYKTSYIQTYNRPYLGMGNAKENASGKNVFIVFFRQGDSGWLEFISPDKNSFIQQFKFDPETIKWDSESDLMKPLLNMSGYNKFAVAASDLKGKWTSDFTGIQQLYNVYTGEYAGMNMNQSNEEFIFTGNTYNWKLLVVKGMVGNAQYIEVKSAGQFSSPNNWQLHFTKIESKARTYHAFWSCIKGARVLNLLPVEAPGSGIYTKYGLAK